MPELVGIGNHPYFQSEHRFPFLGFEKKTGEPGDL
jgi:hypothetical protein